MVKWWSSRRLSSSGKIGNESTVNGWNVRGKIDLADPHLLIGHVNKS
jgi:hypothetical protein